MKRLGLIVLCILLMSGCAGLQKRDIIYDVPDVQEDIQSKNGLLLKKDYTPIFTESGLNIDTDSNDAVDIGYGGTNEVTAAAAADVFGAAMTSTGADAIAGNITAGTILQSQIETLSGESETLGAGWDGDPGIAQKNDIHDYIFQFDPDFNGFTDETWYLTQSVDKTVADDTCTIYGTSAGYGKVCFDSVDGVIEIRDSADAVKIWFDLDNGTVNTVATTSPQTGLYDSDAAGTARDDEYAGGMGADFTTTTEDSEVSDVDIYYMDAGTKTSALTIDGSNNQVKPNIPISTDQEILGAIHVAKVGGAYTIGTGTYDTNEAYGTMWLSDTSAPTLTFNATLVAGMSGCLQQGQGRTDILTITPNTGDYLVVDGARGTAATAYASVGAASDKICWVVGDGTDIYITSKVGTWAE